MSESAKTQDHPYEELEASIDVDAPPAQVWALVSDIPRMASWSPQVVRSTVKGGTVRRGARFSNLNRQGPLFWPTKGKVVRFEPHRDFAFRIAENRTIWSFELADNGRGGTTVTQRRELPDGISTLSIVLTKTVLGGVEGFTRRLERGMRETLDRIKAEAEAAVRA
ncbi:SRPBCC family protein [Nocardioides litoris]|uniref:SRPBCC family protein n=1 Tax=Nocardioides litoris TaxID=1926648 RepID=UPI00111E708B|nr:SRPBCC family protein [Nocardioides litoris]